MQFPCFSSSPWITDRCQAMEVILSFPASGSLADSSGNYVHSFKAVSSSASWVCCFWLVAVSSHLPWPSHGLNIALKIQELCHLHPPLTRAQINNTPCCSLNTSTCFTFTAIFGRPWALSWSWSTMYSESRASTDTAWTIKPPYKANRILNSFLGGECCISAWMLLLTSSTQNHFSLQTKRQRNIHPAPWKSLPGRLLGEWALSQGRT